MKNLIVSLDTYSWVAYCSGTIMRNPKDFEVIIVQSQNDVPIFGYEQFCEKARYEQRKCDIFRIGKKLGVRKISNLEYPTKIDISQLIVQLQFYISLGNVQKVYYQNIKPLNEIFNGISKVIKIPILSYSHPRGAVVERIELNGDERIRKSDLSEMIVGATTKTDTHFPLLSERFFKKEVKDKK